MTTPPPNDFSRELLAAYADGELDGDARARVERWLTDNPDARGELNAQRALSPANTGLWERAEPPQPPEGQWVRQLRAIEARLGEPLAAPRGRAGIWAVVGLAAAMGLAASVAWLAFGPAPPPPPTDQFAPAEQVQNLPRAPLPRESALGTPRPEDPLAGLTVLAVANDDDVVLDRVPEFPAGWLPVGRNPLQGLLSLASEEELLLAELGPSAAWPTGTPKMTTAPGDAPMIYAAKLR
jgi:hypothetical protein